MLRSFIMYVTLHMKGWSKMIPEKITNTSDFSAMITDIRKKHPKNGKIMSKEQVSLAMGKGRTWLSQIETGRLKKISSDDFIKIFEVIFNCSHDKAQQIASYHYEAYIELKLQFTQLLQQFCSTATNQYLSCQFQPQQRTYINFFKNLYFNLTQNYTDFEHLFNGLDLSLLNTVDNAAKDIVYKKMSELKIELRYLKKENVLSTLSFIASIIPYYYTCDDNEKAQGITQCQDGLALLYRLSSGYDKNFYTFEKVDLNSINFFIKSMDDFSKLYYPMLKPINIPVLNTPSLIALNESISILQTQLDLMLQIF